jgi:fluoroquinolone resistance protein
VKFKGSKLMGVDWSELGKLPDMAFEGCDLRYSSFVKLRLRATRFRGCLAREANFIEVDLSEADFAGTELTGATIQGCLLAKTDFSKAIGVFFDPQRNRVKGARIGIGAAVLMVKSLGMEVDGFDE